MVPIHIKRPQICDITWNSLVEQSQQSVIYGFTFYLDLVCDSWEAIVWPVAGPYEIVMPLPVRRKFGFKVIYQPIFCQYLGIFSRSDISASQAEAFLKTVSAQFSYISAYHFNPENDRLLQSLTDKAFNEFSFRKNHTWRLDLASGYERVYGGYSNDRRRNLRIANRTNWQILRSNNVRPLICLFVQHHASKIPGGVNPSAYDRLEMIFERMNYPHAAELWYAHLNGSILAGILVVKYAGKAIFLFNAADGEGRKWNARTWLLDKYFAKWSGGEILFDFESPEIESIAKFYESFGGKKIPYMTISKNRLWPPFRQLQNWRKAGKLKPIYFLTKAFIRFKVHFQRADH